MTTALDDLIRHFCLRGAEPESIREWAKEADKAKSDHRSNRRVIESVARKAAFRAALAGLPGGALAIPLGLISTSSAMKMRVELAAALQLVDNPDFLEDNEWRQRTLEIAYGLPQQPINTRPLVSSALRKTLVRRVARFALKRIATKSLPLGSVLVSGGYEYVSVHIDGRRMLRDMEKANQRFDSAGDDSCASTRASTSSADARRSPDAEEERQETLSRYRPQSSR